MASLFHYLMSRSDSSLTQAKQPFTQKNIDSLLKVFVEIPEEAREARALYGPALTREMFPSFLEGHAAYKTTIAEIKLSLAHALTELQKLLDQSGRVIEVSDSIKELHEVKTLLLQVVQLVVGNLLPISSCIL